MNAYYKRQKQKKRNGIFRKWHRRLGFAASLFLLNLAVTGILLNHYESLDLHKSYISSDWILNLYGVSSPDSAQCSQSGSLSICQLGQLLYLNQQYWRESESELIGSLIIDDGHAIATQSKLMLITAQQQLIEEISFEETLDDNIRQLGLIDGMPAVITSKGIFQLDSALLSWSPVDYSIEPARPLYSPDKDLLSELQRDYRHRQISHLKFIQDIHSGRILMLSGQLINDIAAIVLILLGISGLITWQRRLKNQ